MTRLRKKNASEWLNYMGKEGEKDFNELIKSRIDIFIYTHRITERIIDRILEDEFSLEIFSKHIKKLEERIDELEQK